MNPTPVDTGWIEVVCGPMFSGKTEELLRRLRRDQQQRQRSARYVLQQTLLQTLPGERRFIHPLRRQADVVVRDLQGCIEPLSAQLSLILNGHT